MALKIDTKFEEKLTCASKNDMRNLANFHQSTWKSQNWDFDDILLLEMYEPKIYRGVIRQWSVMQNWRVIELSVENWHEEFDKFWPEHLEILKNCTLMGCFWPKYTMFELKIYRGVMFNGIEYWCKIWRKTDFAF